MLPLFLNPKSLVCVLAIPFIAFAPSVDEAKIVVTIECPRIACCGAFNQSLQKNFVDKMGWIHSVSIEYRDAVLSGEKEIQQDKLDHPFGGQTAFVKFSIDGDVKPEKLALTLKDSGYFQTKGWVLVTRTPFRKLIQANK